MLQIHILSRIINILNLLFKTFLQLLKEILWANILNEKVIDTFLHISIPVLQQ